MGTTARGYRYPDGSAKIGEANQHIKDLADDVDARGGRTIHGTVTIPSGTGAVSVVVSIPGGALPSASYAVVATANSVLITSLYTLSKTTTQFNIYAARSGAGAYTADWILHY